MITLEKIQELDKKIQEAVSLISRLKAENSQLQEQLLSSEERIEILENELGSVKVDHDQIEEGILGALSRMDEITADTERVIEETETDVTISSSVEEPVEREESVIDEEIEEEQSTAEFSFNREAMDMPQSNEQVNHSEPQQEKDQEQGEFFEPTMISDPAEEDEPQDSRSEQDLDIF